MLNRNGHDGLPETANAGPLSGGQGMPARSTHDRRSRDLLREVQRLWVLAAAAKISYEAGTDTATIANIAERAGVARSTVEEMFPDARQCLHAAFEKAAALAAERVIPCFAVEVGAVQRVRVAVMQLLAFCDSERELASVCVAQAAATAERRAKMIDTLSRIVVGEFEDSAQGPAGSGAVAVAVAVDRAINLVHQRLFERGPEPLTDLLPQVLELILTPHIGRAAARIEAGRPAPSVMETPEVWRMPRERRPSLDVRLTADLLSELAAISSAPRSKS